MSEQAHKILVVDDEPDIVLLLKYNLEKEGYTVETAANGEEAVQKCKEFKPEMILLDIMMPKMDGVEACRQIRSDPQNSNIFIIFLTARAEEYSEIAAFDVGANDYLTKPVKPRALLSRIKANFRRDSQSTESISKTSVVEIADFVIDKDSYTLTKNGEDITLPKKEFELIHFLARNPDRVFSRDEILKNIWGEDVYVLARTVDVHIRRIREKIGTDAIKTVKGVGYKFMKE
ncbi:MAG: response regulator transcription factor [Bacteroidota bacterium]